MQILLNKIETAKQELSNKKFSLKGVEFYTKDVKSVGEGGRLLYVVLNSGQRFTAYDNGSGLQIKSNSRLGLNFEAGLLAKHGKDGRSVSMKNTNSDVDTIRAISKIFYRVSSLNDDLNHIEQYGINSFLTSGLRYANQSEKDFYAEFLKEEVEESKVEEIEVEYKDFSSLGFGIEFVRGSGFFKTSKDNFLIGTFWFETESERDFEFNQCVDFYSKFTEERAISSESEELIWNRLFTNNLSYDMV